MVLNRFAVVLLEFLAHFAAILFHTLIVRDERATGVEIVYIDRSTFAFDAHLQTRAE
jgi:hypothetical protein